MSREALESNVLVINELWEPLDIVSGFEAIGELWEGKAKAVDENYQMYDFDLWIETWSDAIHYAKVSADRVVSNGHTGILVPEIVQRSTKKSLHSTKPKCSRSGIFTRDKMTCQYCKKQFTAKQLNLDHVIPKSRGGKSTWTNLVLSCYPCNHKKANRTPSEANMRLMKEPREPAWTFKKGVQLRKPLKSWEQFLGAIYWNAELDPT